MKKIFKILASHQKLIKNLFLIIYIGLIGLYLFAIWYYPQMTKPGILFLQLGKRFGQASVVLLTLTLIPGILKRLDLFKVFEPLLVLFRRQIGVLAFFTAFVHLGFSSWITMIAHGVNPLSSLFKFQQTGFVALTIFFLLWVTSNNYSMKLLGKWWKYLQRLSYVSILVLILHIYSNYSNWWLPLTLMLSLEISSWVVFYYRNRKDTISSASE